MTNSEIIQQFKDWVFGHVAPPRPQFGGLPICPFAKTAITIKDTVEIWTIDSASINSFGQVIYKMCLDNNWKEKEILIFIDKEKYSNEEIETIQNYLNRWFKNEEDLIAFKDHPDDPVIIDGVNTSYPHYPFIMVQKRKNIDVAHEELKKTEYYSRWSKQNLDDVVNWRL